MRIVLGIYEAIKALATHPYNGRPATKPGRRELILADLHDLVTYRVRETTVEVVRIRHTARKPLRL